MQTIIFSPVEYEFIWLVLGMNKIYLKTPAPQGLITCPVQLKVNSETPQGPTLQGYKKEHGNGNRQRDVLDQRWATLGAS
jgi:hypothetical protein